MSKIAHYLQEHLMGEVMTNVDARRYFSTDAGIFSVAPALVVYPRNENDVRKTARFTWQLAERGRIIPLTARGAGTDQSGAAIGSGIMLVFPAHMNRILELDTKSGVVTVEPGINFGKLQQTLATHSRFVPAYPASAEYSTVGGAVANNSSGEKSVKYGDMRQFVRSLRVVLANGEVIETGRLSKRELSKKLGLSTFEGEIYRQLDTLLEEHRELIERTLLPVTRNNSGYHLLDVRRRDGSFDLTPLIVGSQGTLGVVTEATLESDPHNPETTLLMAAFASLEHMQQAILELRGLQELPSALEMVDGNLLEQVQMLNPNLLKEVIQPPYPTALLFVEYDNASDRLQHKLAKRAQKILQKYAAALQVETVLERQQQLWKIRQATATLLGHANGQQRAIPVVDDAIVPVDKLREFMEGVHGLCQRLGVPVALWGHAGDGNVHFQPQLNIGQVGDRQKALRLLEDYYKLVISLGGSPSGERNDGRLRAPHVPLVYGNDIYALFQKLKQIFDPYGTLNPGVKLGTTMDGLKSLLRSDYDLSHFYDHLPRS